MISVTASPVTLMPRTVQSELGAQLRMEDGNYVYITPDVARQWVEVLNTIATNEESNNA